MDCRRSALLAASVALTCVCAPAFSADELKAAHSCRALVVHPSAAINLQRPAALRYRAAPLRFCMPDDTNTLRRTIAT